MKNLKNHLKVLSTLSLASSDTREDTLTSVIIRTLFVNGKTSSKEIVEKIKHEFDFEPYQSEINALLAKLEQSNRIEISGGNIELLEDAKNEITKLETSIADEDKARFLNFKTFISDDLELYYEIDIIKFLWDVFLEYLYDSFFEYGHEAIKTLHPHIENDKNNNGTYEDELQKALKTIRKKNPDLVEVFKQIVERFPDFASERDLVFLNDLAQKTLSFTSLGIEPGLADSTIDHNIVDWVLYLDTNVLYSLLNIRPHKEDQACHALLKLIQDNKDYIKIALRYSELTYKELGAKRKEFDSLDEKMPDSSIRAMLKANKIDAFSRKFYEDLLSSRDTTVHPSKVIELSQRTMKQDTIEIGRTGKRLENLGEEYIESRIGDYFSFLEQKNTIRREFCEDKKITYNAIYRSEKQVRHDVSLREIILDSRTLSDGQEVSLNNLKYFAITLDDVLISYDIAKVRDNNDERSFPTFFKPSFLLNRLIKVLPIKTTDYKKAFIKAITTKGFHRNTERSEDILKIVNYLKSKGISDEKVIYNLISKDIFLKTYRQHSESSDFDAGEFIESELNREIAAKEKELQETRENLEETIENTIKIEGDNEILANKKDGLESEVNQYKTAIGKLSKKLNKLEKSTVSLGQVGFNFEAAEEKDKNSELKTKLKRQLENRIDDYKDQSIKKWQNRVWLNLIWVIPSIVMCCLLLIPNDILYFDEGNISDGTENKIPGIIVTVVASIMNFFFLWIIRKRYFSESEKKSKRDNIKIPADLQTELDKLEN